MSYTFDAAASSEGSGAFSLLDVLRSRSAVDVDSLDSSFAAAHAPFVDATSNQAIAYTELSKPENAKILAQASQIAEKEASKWPEVSLVALAVEVAQVLLAIKMVPYLRGRFHIQANPFDAYSTERTIRCGERLQSLVSIMSSAETSQRLCLKVPATFEGLMACKTLENEHGIRTLATTLFTLEQGVLAGEVGCTYIAPYVNELPVHFVEGYTDVAPNNKLVVDIQRYYEAQDIATKVLPASLTTPAECMLLAGAQHITIAPSLLQSLAATSAPQEDELDSMFPSLFRQTGSTSPVNSGKPLSFLNEEASYRLAVTRNDRGKQEKKLVDAINIFSDMQDNLEGLLNKVMRRDAGLSA